MPIFFLKTKESKNIYKISVHASYLFAYEALSMVHSEDGLALWSSPDDPLLPVLDDGFQEASSPVVVIITVVLFGTLLF